jgi:hypothetical protein
MRERSQRVILPGPAIGREETPSDGAAGQERGLDPAAQASVAAGDGAVGAHRPLQAWISCLT